MYHSALSPMERLAVELDGTIKKQRAFVQKHLPSLATIRRLLEAVHAVIMRPHIIAMANAIQQMYGGSEAHDGGHWGSGGTLLTYEATTENTAGIEHDPAAVAGNLKSTKQQGRRRAGKITHFEYVELVATLGSSGIPAGPVKYIPSEANHYIEEALLKPLSANRAAAHGVSNAAAAVMSTDDPRGQGQWLAKLQHDASPAVFEEYGDWMTAIVADLPHGWRKLLEPLLDKHMDAGSVKMTITDTVSRFLWPPPGFGPLDMLHRGKIEAPTLPADAIAELQSNIATEVMGSGAPTLTTEIDGYAWTDLALAVYAERIVRTGSLGGIPAMVVAHFRTVATDGLAAALPWSCCVDVAVFDEIVGYAITAFHLDDTKARKLAGKPSPPRLVLQKFAILVLEPGAELPPMKNHVDIFSCASYKPMGLPQLLAHRVFLRRRRRVCQRRGVVHVVPLVASGRCRAARGRARGGRHDAGAARAQHERCGCVGSHRSHAHHHRRLYAPGPHAPKSLGAVWRDGHEQVYRRSTQA